MRAWRIATDAPGYLADDLTGAGAKITGGRWNRAGWPILYCADSPSLACLETLVHLGTGDLPLNRYLVAIDIPDQVWNAREIHALATLPVGWDANSGGHGESGFWRSMASATSHRRSTGTFDGRTGRCRHSH
jgi:RES domain-containing protein